MTLRLAPRIVLLFVLFASVLLASVGVFSYRSGSEDLKAAVLSEMLSIGLEKEAALDTWFTERKDDIGQVAVQSDVVQKAADLIAAAPASRESRSAHAVLLKELQPHVDSLRSFYTEVFVMEPEKGRVVASTRPAEEGKSKAGHPYFDNGKAGLYMQALYQSVDVGVPGLTIGAPLRAADGRVVAVLAFRLDIAIFSGIVQRGSGIHKTEDSFLLNAEGLFVTQPRFIAEPVVLRRKLDTATARRVVERKSGVMEAPDYRGVPVIAVYRWISAYRIGLIVKVDRSEVLAPVNAFRRSVILISILALLAAVGLASLLARTITAPLRALRAGLKSFAEGTMTDPLPESSDDELNLLTREFNAMAARVAERTAKLAEANGALESEITERKSADENSMRFYALVENSSEYVSMASPDGKVFYLNPAGRRMSGIAHDADVRSINWRDFFDDENWKIRLEVAIPTLVATGRWDGEIRMRNLETGRLLDLRVQGFRVDDPRTGAPLCIATIQRDITASKRSKEALLQKERLLSESQRLGRVGSWLFDMKGPIATNGPISWSDEMYRLFGVSPVTFTPTPESVLGLLHPDDRPAMKAWFAACAKGEKPGELEYRVNMPDSTIRVLTGRGEAVHDAGDGFIHVAGTVQDITERKRAEAELQRFRDELERRVADATTINESLQRQTEELSRLNGERAALGNMNDLLPACATPDEAYEIFGRAAAGLFPSLSGALHIFAASRNLLTPAATWGEWPEAAIPASPESCWGVRRGKCYVGNGTTTPPCGHAGPAPGLSTLCVPVTAYGEVLGVLHLRGSDASTVQSMLQLATIVGDGLALTVANLRLRESLQAQSIRDPLTDLYNRRYMAETLEREFARAQRSGAPVAVIMIDVDHFKRFNDTFGHEAGDAVLRELGTFFRRSIRAEDIACRYGGEEFCLVLPQMDREGALSRAEAIRAGAAGLEVKLDGRAIGPVTLSLGVALFPEDAETIASVIAAADASLYQAKRDGRNRVVVSRVPGAPDSTARADAPANEASRPGVESSARPS